MKTNHTKQLDLAQFEGHTPPQYHDHNGARHMEEISNYAACDPQLVAMADACFAKQED